MSDNTITVTLPTDYVEFLNMFGALNHMTIQGALALIVKVRMDEARALTQRPAAQEVDDYGSSEIGWAFIVARDLEPQEKRLMSMLDKAFGSRHPAVDDMVHLILTRSARHQPGSMISGDAARQHPEIKPSKALMQNVWRALKLSLSICDAVPTRAHETDGPMRALGLLVNNVDGEHGYAFIRDTLAKVEQFQRGQAQPVCSIDERAAFEMWIKKDCGDLRTFGTGLNTHYCNSAVNNAWIAWQARASLPAPQQATPERHLTVTTNQQGEAVMVSWQDDEHRVLEVVWERKQATPEPVGEPIKYQPGEWYEAKDRDDLEAFFRSRLPAIREAAREHGYAIGVHGSMRRDLDLIAAPWREGASEKDTLAHAIAMAACGITRDGPYQWEEKPLGRVAASLSCCWPSWFNEAGAGHIDLSVVGITRPAPAAQAAPMAWPAARDVGRYGDMHPLEHMRVGLDSDNDVYVSVWGEDGGAKVEFCNPGGGGGGSSRRTREALIALMVAMEADNADRPDKDWWARRNAQAKEVG